MRRIEIELDKPSKSELVNFVRKGERIVREITRARILMLANSGKHNDEIADILGVDRDTVLRVKIRYLKDSVGKAIHDDPRPGQLRRYSDSVVTEVMILACSTPPVGRKKWSVRLLAEELGKRESLNGINRETVRLILKKQ